MMDIKKMKVLIAELLDDSAIKMAKENFQADIKYKLSREELLKIIPEYDAIVVRSETQIDEEFLDAAKKLKIVGRAGSGLDNIDIPYATKKGVVVANTPESNIVSAAEHTMALLLGTSRNVAWADRFIKKGDWDRKRFKGSELYQKTIGIIGLGRIGGLISKRLRGFDVEKIVAYDPYITDARFKSFGVEKKNSIEELVKESDFITIHTPRTKETIGIISDKEIEMMKDGVRLVNVARGGLYDEDALVRGMKAGKIASVGIDVWNNEPQEEHELYQFETMIGTPHLGASTVEAQRRVGEEAVKEVIAGLKGEIVKNAVNIPSVSETTFKKLASFLKLSEKIGQIYSQIKKEGIEEIEMSFIGKEIEDKEDIKILSLIALKGILDSTVPETVNFVNANYIAEQRGIKVKENMELEGLDYNNLMRLKVTGKDGGKFEIFGTVLEGKYPRVVRIQEYEMDLTPEGKLLYAPHINRPGVVGKVGIAMSEYNVNISKMIVSNGTEDSIMILSVDNNVPEVLIENLKGLEEIKDIKVINL
ncbi:MAG: phosphoglycerate dehydrogenase [Fusobacteriia bacterium 4572_132]|nr:MAG: phosphoglycerate dehydrogenase [Fusobacteriia bacterium 4572_132]